MGVMEPPMEMFKGAPPVELESERLSGVLRVPMGLISPPIEMLRVEGVSPIGLMEPPMEMFREGASSRMMARPLAIPARETIVVRTMEEVVDFIVDSWKVRSLELDCEDDSKFGLCGIEKRLLAVMGKRKGV